MIAFGTAVSNLDVYRRIALPGIRRVAEPDSHLLLREDCDSIQRPYNEMLAEAAALPNLEALVLLHQDLELTDDSLPRRVRRILRDPRVGLIGALGGNRDENWQLHRWTEPIAGQNLFGTAMGPSVGVRFSTGSDEVEVVDGALLVIAPWVAKSLRFAERLAENFHGYDMDFSLRVAAVGGKVVCDDVPYFHHMARRGDHEALRLAGIDLARMWDPALRPREWASAFQP